MSLHSSNLSLFMASDISFKIRVFSREIKLKKAVFWSVTHLKLCGFLFSKFWRRSDDAFSSLSCNFLHSKCVFMAFMHDFILPIITKTSSKSRLNSSFFRFTKTKSFPLREFEYAFAISSKSSGNSSSLYVFVISFFMSFAKNLSKEKIRLFSLFILKKCLEAAIMLWYIVKRSEVLWV